MLTYLAQQYTYTYMLILYFLSFHALPVLNFSFGKHHQGGMWGTGKNYGSRITKLDFSQTNTVSNLARAHHDLNSGFIADIILGRTESNASRRLLKLLKKSITDQDCKKMHADIPSTTVHIHIYANTVFFCHFMHCLY